MALPSPKGASPDSCARSRPAAGEIPPLMAAGSFAPGATGAGAGAGAGAEAAAGGAARGMPSAIAAEQSWLACSETRVCAAASRAAEGFALFVRVLRGELNLVMSM
jgi:hypothetical protein